ncbi:MAG: hypothetical protein L3K23_05695 [Thermoplasmata archaeon]|nr:hypothetical protein [Thermoplasmata archaeon]
MVNASLTLGALVGVLLAGGFVYWQIGRYAAPQVPVTLFDEKREVYAFVIGLFVGVPLTLFLLFLTSAANRGAVTAALIDLGIVVAGAEVAQWVLLRTRYFGEGSAGPFYALGLRAGIGGILSLGVVAQALEQTTLTLGGLSVALLQSLALVCLQVATALVALPGRTTGRGIRGSPVASGLLGAGGIGLLFLAANSGVVTGLVGAALVTAGAVVVYRGRRDATLGTIRPPGEPAPPSSPFGRREP